MFPARGSCRQILRLPQICVDQKSLHRLYPVKALFLFTIKKTMCFYPSSHNAFDFKSEIYTT